MQEEVWKDVVGFEQYFQVSNIGRVFSKRTNIILNQWERKNGYMTIATTIGGRNGINYCFKVHRLVAEAFLEPPSEELIEKCSNEHHGKVLVLHKDHNKKNNNVENLKWGTNLENMLEYNATEKFQEVVRANSGTLCVQSKLTKEDVEYIREVYIPRDKEFGCRALSRQFGMSHKSILNVILNRSYTLQ